MFRSISYRRYNLLNTHIHTYLHKKYAVSVIQPPKKYHPITSDVLPNDSEALLMIDFLKGTVGKDYFSSAWVGFGWELIGTKA